VKNEIKIFATIRITVMLNRSLYLFFIPQIYIIPPFNLKFYPLVLKALGINNTVLNEKTLSI